MLETVIAVAIIAITAKLFDFYGYRRCFNEVCDRFNINEDDLSDEMKKHCKKNEDI